MSYFQDSNGSKMWQCNACGHARERKTDIKRHIESKHIDMQLSCQYCDSVFKSSRGLNEHCKIIHYK